MGNPTPSVITRQPRQNENARRRTTVLAARAKACRNECKGEEKDWRQSSVATAQRISCKWWKRLQVAKEFETFCYVVMGRRKGRRKERIQPITGRSANRYKQMHLAEAAPSLQCDQPKLNPLEVRRATNRGGDLTLGRIMTNHDTGTKPGGREDGGAVCRSRASSGVEKLRVSGDPRISCRNAHRSQVAAGLGVAMKWCEVSKTLALLIIPILPVACYLLLSCSDAPGYPSQSLSSYARIAWHPPRSFARICLFLPAQLKLGK